MKRRTVVPLLTLQRLERDLVAADKLAVRLEGHARSIATQLRAVRKAMVEMNQTTLPIASPPKRARAVGIIQQLTPVLLPGEKVDFGKPTKRRARHESGE